MDKLKTLYIISQPKTNPASNFFINLLLLLKTQCKHKIHYANTKTLFLKT